MACCNCCCQNQVKRNECRLDDKGIVFYDLCNPDYYDAGENFSYIGQGIIYSCQGTVQMGKQRRMHFWVKLK